MNEDRYIKYKYSDDDWFEWDPLYGEVAARSSNLSDKSKQHIEEIRQEYKTLNRIYESNRLIRSNTILVMGFAMLILGIVCSFLKDDLSTYAIYPSVIVAGFITCMVVKTKKEYK